MRSFLLIFASMLFLQSWAQDNSKLNAADTEFQAENYQNAIRLYTEAIESKELTDCSYIFYKRGYCYYELVNFKAAKSDFETALKVSPDNKNYDYIKGSTYWMYSRLYSQHNQYSKAVKMLLLAKEYNQESSLYSTLGYEENNAKKYKDAIVHLDIAISIDKNNAYAYSNRAYSYLKVGELEKARADINTSILLDNKNPYVYKHSALIYIKLKQYDLACADLQRAIELGYQAFGNETDRNEVDQLMKKYCR